MQALDNFGNDVAVVVGHVGFITPWEVALGVTLLLWLLCWRCALSRARW